jgi:hypothetical protein
VFAGVLIENQLLAIHSFGFALRSSRNLGDLCAKAFNRKEHQENPLSSLSKLLRPLPFS